MSQRIETAQEEEQMNRNSPGYQRWLGERSCSEYAHEKRYGKICNVSRDPKKVNYMFSKKMKMLLVDCDLCVFMVTEEGEVYYWYDRADTEPEVQYYSQLIYLSNTRFVQTAAGGNSTFIALTEDERVYYFQTKYHKVYDWMKQMKFKKKVICISCGSSFFVVITDDYKVYTWGMNDSGQLGNSTCTNEFIEELHEVNFPGNTIVKVACGFIHTLALSNEGNIFVWGGNVYGQLGLNHRKPIPSPIMVVVTPKPMKILDITAMKYMSSAIAENGYIYVWGSCFDQQIRKPIACEYTTLFDVSNALSARPPTSVKYLNADERSNILKDLANAFNNPSHSDLAIRVGALYIYVHKVMLKIRSKMYFDNIVQFMTSENGQDVIMLNQFSYTMYHAFLKYLYTGNIDLSLEQKFDLLKLAEEFKEPNFEKSCYDAIKKEITEENVFSIYRMAKRYNKAIVKKFCFMFFKKNKDDIMDTDSFIKLDEETKNIFMDG